MQGFHVVDPGSVLDRGAGQWFSLVDEHDRDVVPDRVAQLAMVTQQPLLVRTQGDLLFALGADKNFQQILVDSHFFLLWRFSVAGSQPGENPLHRLGQIRGDIVRLLVLGIGQLFFFFLAVAGQDQDAVGTDAVGKF